MVQTDFERKSVFMLMPLSDSGGYGFLTPSISNETRSQKCKGHGQNNDATGETMEYDGEGFQGFMCISMQNLEGTVGSGGGGSKCVYHCICLSIDVYVCLSAVVLSDLFANILVHG